MYAFPRITIPQRAIEEAKVPVPPPLPRLRTSAYEAIRTRLFDDKLHQAFTCKTLFLCCLVVSSTNYSITNHGNWCYFSQDDSLRFHSLKPSESPPQLVLSAHFSCHSDTTMTLMLMFSSKVKGIPPDEFYCWQVLEKTGSYVVPGRAFNMNGSGNHYYFR